MGTHLDMAQRQIEDRSELSRVRGELAIQRRALANLEEREASILGRMNERLTAMAALLEADKVVGLPVEAQDADEQIDGVDPTAESEVELVDLSIVSDGPVDRPNGAAAF